MPCYHRVIDYFCLIILFINSHQVIDTVGENGVVGLINSAGLNIGPYPVEFVDPDLLTKQMDVNVTGQVRVRKHTTLSYEDHHDN